MADEFASQGFCREETTEPESDLEESAGARRAGLPRLTREQQELVCKHFGLIGIHLRRHVPTSRMPMRHREYQDLFQEGCVALVRAAARYRPETDGVFAAFAIMRIRGAIHRALHERFSLIHIPARAALNARKHPIGKAAGELPGQILELNPELEKNMTVEHTSSQPQETIGHVIRRRYELAVRRTLEAMRKRKWRQRNPCEIMARFAEERLLIDSARERTPLRQIARDFGISCGRVGAYERNFVAAVKETFAADPQLRALVKMAREDARGHDSPMDAERYLRLSQAEVAAFEEHFCKMPAADRAETIYSLLERSSDCVPEVASNLFRLTMSDGQARRTVA